MFRFIPQKYYKEGVKLCEMDKSFTKVMLFQQVIMIVEEYEQWEAMKP
jgi:hypothetical protein